MTGVCEACNTTDPDCRYTTDYCDASCHKSEALGIYRGIQINQVGSFAFSKLNFARGF